MKNCQNVDFQFTLLDLASSVKSLFFAWFLKLLYFSTYNLYFSTSFYLIGKLVQFYKLPVDWIKVSLVSVSMASASCHHVWSLQHDMNLI